MIERWTVWNVEGEDGLVLQCSLALVDPITWDVLREWTMPVGASRSLQQVKLDLRSKMKVWVSTYGIRLALF